MNKYLKLIIATLLSFAGIYFSFSGEDFDNLFIEISKVNLPGLIISTLLLIFSCIIRSYRWKILIDPLEKISIKKFIAQQ